MNCAPPTTTLFASRATAVNCCVFPGDGSVALGGETLTVATSCATDTCALPVTAPLLADTLATPLATAVTRPVPLTVTTPDGDAPHVNVMPEMVPPPASCADALSRSVSPIASSVSLAGVTRMDATAGGGGG